MFEKLLERKGFYVHFCAENLLLHYISVARVGELTPNGFSGCSIPAIPS